MKINRRYVLMSLGILSIIIIVVGTSIAFFTYAKTGSTENTLSNGNITFLYDEIDKKGNGIVITDAIPVADNTGKGGQAFDFRITSHTVKDGSIPYEITVRKKADSDDIGSIVKLYLTKVDSLGNEEQVKLEKYDELPTVVRNGYQEKQIHIDKVPDESNYIQDYKLRMWIADDADYSGTIKYYCGTTEITQAQYENMEYTCVSGEKNIQNEYPYNGKTFSIMVNVYSNGHIVTDTDKENAGKADITTLSVNSTNLTETSDGYYETEVEPDVTSAVIDIETVNPYTSVVIEKTDSTFQNVIAMNDGVTKLSLTKRFNITYGEDNYFRIRLVSEDTTTTDELHLKIKSKPYVWTYTYESSAQSHEYSLQIPFDGNYKLEVWGAQGGDANSRRGGFGAYATGIAYLDTTTTLNIVPGSKGITANNNAKSGGYNGGGNSYTSNTRDTAGSGGGATHIATVTGLLKDLSEYKDTAGENRSNEILIVAGAGGGGYYFPSFNSIGGNAGGYLGGLAPYGTCGEGRTNYTGSAATQTDPGSSNGCGGDFRTSYASFGLGASNNAWYAGGGAGWYGGGFGMARGGNGGTSYIASPNLSNGKMYCYDCSESTDALTYTVSTAGTTTLSQERDTVNCPDGYSDNPISKCAKSGNGYVKITYLGQ